MSDTTKIFLSCIAAIIAGLLMAIHQNTSLLPL